MSDRVLDRASKLDGLENAALNRLDYWAIAGVVFAAAIPRLLLLYALPPLLHLDSDSYFEIAQRLWRGDGFGDLSRRTPLYPFLLSLFANSAKLGLFPVVIVQHIFGIAGAVLLFLIARRLYGPGYRLVNTATSILAALAMFPVMIEHTVLTESFFSFLLLCSAWAALAWREEAKSRQATIAGALLGLAALTKPVALGIFPIWAVLLFLFEDRKKALQFCKWAGAALLLLILPLLVRNAVAMGRPALTESLGRNLISVGDRFVDFDHGANLPLKAVYREFMPDKRGQDAVIVYAAMPRLRAATRMSDVDIDRALAAIGWEAIREHPFSFIASRLRRLPAFWRDPNEGLWQSLREETYFPMVSFVGKQNPEMVARSLRLRQLRDARFDLSRWCSTVFGFQFPSGWWMLLPLMGIFLTLWRGNRIGGVLLASLLFYLWATSIFLQPPNARYRMPTFSLEILFTVSCIFYSAKLLAGWWEKYFPNRRDQRLKSILPPIVLFGGLAFFCVRLVAAFHERHLLTLKDWQGMSEGNSSIKSFQDSSHLIQELSVAGRKFPVVYWAGSSGGESGRVGARLPIAAGGSYRVLAAYSCSLRACADGALHVIFFDAQSTPLSKGAEIFVPLSQDRTDSDIFWDQIEKRFRAPEKAVSAQLEIVFREGGGNVVVPFLTVEQVGTTVD